MQRVRGSGVRRKLLVGVVLVAAMLAGCGGSDESAAQSGAGALSLTERLAQYEASLRAEADWLWDNMISARSHGRPDAARCQRPDFAHPVVELDEAGRSQDSAVAVLEQLTYAETLIAQARDFWQAHCDGTQSSANTAAFLQSRLDPAYSALQRALAGIEARRRVEARR